MSYTGITEVYRIPYMLTGDQMTGADNTTQMTIIENLLRASILSEGETRVFTEGTYTTAVNADQSVNVTLAGTPAIRGVVLGGLVEVNGSITWTNIPINTFSYLWLFATTGIYVDPTAVSPQSGLSQPVSNATLFLATLNNTAPGYPILDTNPSGKPTAANLYQLLNSPTNPFGASLTQSNLTVTNSLTVTLGVSNTVLIKQQNAAASVAVITVQNTATVPEIKSTGSLRFADIYTNLTNYPAGISFSDVANPGLPDGAVSILDSLKRASKNTAVSLPYSAALATDVSKGNTFTVLLTGNVTLSNPTNPTDGQKVVWRFTQDATGGRTVTLGAIFSYGSDVVGPFVASVGPNKIDYLEAIYNLAVNKWHVTKISRGY